MSKNYKQIGLFMLGLIVVMSCNNLQSKKTNENNVLVTTEKRAKFEPIDGKCILFVGQDMEAIGGLEKYNDGYFDHFDTPGGFTMYTNFRTGDASPGITYKGLDGLTTTDNWGSGDCNMQMQIDDPDFKHCALAIGLELVNHDSLTAVGGHDDMIHRLGNWIKDLGRRPVFLRIGYEFDAPEWNHYDKEFYKESFKRIRNQFDSLGVNNVAYVWQSKGWGTSTEEYDEWYPGDEYVDWCGYSHFVWGVKGGKTMIDFARKHKKPVFIAEATPMVFEGDTLPIDCYLDNPEHAKMAANWFDDFFKVIHDNPDVIKAISYINIDWYKQDMWASDPPFKHIDSRIQVSPLITEKWIKETSTERYLKSDPKLFDQLWEN